MDSAILEKLGNEAAEIAMQSAAQYIQAHNLSVSDYETAIECLRTRVRNDFPKIMDEVKAAMDLGMEDVATQTFRAGMTLIGIDAAKEFAK